MVLGGLQSAFDLNQEPAAVRDRYGRHSLGEKTFRAQTCRSGRGLCDE
jgi:hypothetical protein